VRRPAVEDGTETTTTAPSRVRRTVATPRRRALVRLTSAVIPRLRAATPRPRVVAVRRAGAIAAHPRRFRAPSPPPHVRSRTGRLASARRSHHQNDVPMPPRRLSTDTRGRRASPPPDRPLGHRTLWTVPPDPAVSRVSSVTGVNRISRVRPVSQISRAASSRSVNSRVGLCSSRRNRSRHSRRRAELESASHKRVSRSRVSRSSPRRISRVVSRETPSPPLLHMSAVRSTPAVHSTPEQHSSPVVRRPTPPRALVPPEQRALQEREPGTPTRTRPTGRRVPNNLVLSSRVFSSLAPALSRCTPPAPLPRASGLSRLQWDPNRHPAVPEHPAVRASPENRGPSAHRATVPTDRNSRLGE
jgi:hypothetical protein